MEQNQQKAVKLTAAYDMLYLAACGINQSVPEWERVQHMEWKSVYQMCAHHNLSAITDIAIEACLAKFQPDLTEKQTEILAKWKETKEKAIRKNILLDIERTQLLTFCEQKGIWYLPLKGILLKVLYPKPGMRQMADNDILFDAAYEQEICKWFTAHGYFAKSVGRSIHDIYQKPPVLNFEMHKELFSPRHNLTWAEYYADVKSQLLRDEGKQYGFHFSNEDFYIYMMLHAYKHYIVSGTGLRSLLDCYVYQKAKGEEMDWAYIEKQSQLLGITEYEQDSRVLSKKIFSNPKEFQHEILTEKEQELLNYHLLSGTYGTQQHQVQNRLSGNPLNRKKVSVGTKLRYLKNRIFPERVFMEKWCSEYAPFFERHPNMLLAAYFWRGINCGVKNTGRCYEELKNVFKF